MAHEVVLSDGDKDLEIRKIRRSKEQWDQDCTHYMPELAAYLNSSRIPESVEISIDNLKMIDPVFPIACVTLDSLLEQYQKCIKSDQQDIHMNDLSVWIYHVEWFVRNGMSSAQSCQHIMDLMLAYIEKACPLYSDPVHSRLTVTILKFVAVLDEIGFREHPFLNMYKTGIKPKCSTAC